MSAASTVLILGGSGQIGSELRALLSATHCVVAPDRAQLDCMNAGAAAAAIADLAPGVVINAAAFTRVDDAEVEREAALRMNAALPGELAVACEAVGAGLVHFSTDYVFAGDSTRPYREDDATAPINWYGDTKLRGEQEVMGKCSSAVVLRTSWIYGLHGQNFLRTMLRLAREREEIRVVDDQVGAPTSARSVAQGTAVMVARLGLKRDAWRSASSVYHMTAGGVTSWFGFAKRLLELDPQRATHAVRRLLPIASDEYPTRATRPRYSVLDCTRLAQRFDVRLDPWETQLEAVLSRLQPAGT